MVGFTQRLAYGLLVIVTLVARLRGGSWFAPAAIVGLVWTFFITGSLFVVDYPIPARGKKSRLGFSSQRQEVVTL